LIHVVDVSNSNFPEQMAEVQRVLHEIHADQVTQILVFNKVDALPAERRPIRMHDRFEVDGISMERVFLSAQSGEGVATLRQVLANCVLQQNDDVLPQFEPFIPE